MKQKPSEKLSRASIEKKEKEIANNLLPSSARHFFAM
jgi:hypothetical protein